MRSWSIPVGRLFGVEVRIHLTFFILPMFVFWTEYNAHQGIGQRTARPGAGRQSFWPAWPRMNADTCWPRRRMGMIPKAVILLPLTGVTLYDETRAEKPQPAAAALEARSSHRADRPARESRARRHLRLRSIIRRRCAEANLWKWPFLQAANLPKQPGLGKSLSCGFESHARLSSRWRPHPASIFRAHASTLPPPPAAPFPSATPSPWS